MFGLFKKDPVKKLEKEHEQILLEAMNMQRKGDLKSYAELTAKAEKIEQEIIDLRAAQ